MPLADDVLLRLLKRGEGAALRNSGRAIQERFQDAGLGYWHLPLDERDRCHERLRAAEKAGSVELKWASQGGDDRPIEIVRLRDLAKLAAFLEVGTVASAVARAEECLAPWRRRVPRVDELLERWSVLKKVRGLSTMSAADFADALCVLDALEARQGDDQIVRTLSVELFGNSKRIERLDRHLDILTGESLAAPARHWNEVFSALGLVKEPQPFLIAGTGEILLASGDACPIVKPFVGVSNKAVNGYVGSPRWLLTIENLTTFHVASQLLDGGGGLILYTAGMPSPSWCAGYKRILVSLPIGLPIYHWGDIDPGGFRIAAYLRRWVEPQRQFFPWLMDINSIDHKGAGTAASQTEAQEMRRFARLSEWDDLASRLRGICIEQEAITLSLPQD